MEATSIEFLSRFVGDLRRTFDAEVIDAWNDMDGAIVVDVRFDVQRAFRVQRELLRQRLAMEIERSRELCDTSTALMRRADDLVGQLRNSDMTRRDSTGKSRAVLEITRALKQGIPQPKGSLQTTSG